MKKGQKLVIGLSLLAIVGLVASIGLVSAYRGDPSVQGPNFDSEQHLLMTQAFDDVDYDAWVALMRENGRSGRVLELVNEENFETFAKSRDAALAGDHELAAQLRAQIGLGNGEGPRDGAGYRQGGRGEGRGMHAGKGNCYAQ